MAVNQINLFKELQRRRVFRTATLYVVIAWLMIEVADVLLETFNAPDWVMQAFVIVLALGFPVAMVVSWLFDLTPAGFKADSEQAIVRQSVL